EIVETPVSVVGRIMMGVIVILVSVAIGWACFGQIDIVATANGRIIPSGQVKVIQPLEIGVMKRIRVADGDHVTAGDVLIEIDPTTDAADRDRIARDLMQAELDIARLRAALALDPGTFVPPSAADPALADAERRQLVAQLAQHKAKIEGLDQQIAAKAAERDQAKATIAKLDDSIPLLQAKADIYDKLRENQLTSQITRLDSERQLSEAKHDRLVTGHQVEGLQAQIASLIEQRSEADAEFRGKTLDALGKATQYAAEQRQELIKAAQRTGFQELRAPVAGTVEQLSVHTIGGVVQPAQTLMVVVPDDSKLEVEAMLPNRDAGFVHAGEAAELKVEAFTYTRYGLLHGTVRSVSRDALRKEQDAPSPDRDTSSAKSLPADGKGSGSASAYVARISLAETSVETEQGPLPLEPGMTVTAEIKTGQRRVISYVLSPFMRYRHEALRER
ncbi:MAG: HlyD family type I secretion periplasmic adaptor subunit, partial [Stellaceae bacterium]